MADQSEDGWSRFTSERWARTYTAWRHTSGAVVWRHEDGDERNATWCYSSDDVRPSHGDFRDGPHPQPPRATSLAAAKSLALILAHGDRDTAANIIEFYTGPPRRGTVADIETALEQMVYQHVPVGVWVEGLVLTIHHGWRAKVLRLAMWMIHLSGHTVIRHPGKGSS